jgi:hypothetical protein
MEKIAGSLLIVGSLLFFIAAFTPANVRVVMASDPQQRAEFAENDRGGWLIANVVFGVASIAAVAGLALFGIQAQSTGDLTQVRVGSVLGTAAAAIGTALWVIILYNRVVSPLQEMTSNLSTNPWIFPAYTLLMQIALVIVGVVLLRSNYPGWLGWGVLAFGALTFAAYMFFKDMPPFAHYVPLLVMGITLVR